MSIELGEPHWLLLRKQRRVGRRLKHVKVRRVVLRDVIRRWRHCGLLQLLRQLRRRLEELLRHIRWWLLRCRLRGPSLLRRRQLDRGRWRCFCGCLKQRQRGIYLFRHDNGLLLALFRVSKPLGGGKLVRKQRIWEPNLKELLFD